jgi:hypothetical protein
MSDKKKESVRVKDGELNTIWFKAGGGFDWELANNFFFRLEALYGLRLPSKAEKESIDIIKTMNGGNGVGKPVLGHGFTVKAAFGKRF